MTDMIERAAAALYASDQSDDGEDYYLKHARAALDAIEAPTLEMIKAAAIELLKPEFHSAAAVVIAIWRTMHRTMVGRKPNDLEHCQK